MKTNRKGLMSAVAAFIVAMILLAGFVFGLEPEPPVAEAAGGASWPLTINSSSIAADTTWTARQWSWDGSIYDEIEIFYSIDQGTTNTTTLYLDVSPDNSLWVTGYSTIVSANAADATSYATATIRGRYYRIRADTTNTNTITPTVQVILRDND
jgi:hypothetical protein